jgi:hypothetical protein
VFVCVCVCVCELLCVCVFVWVCLCVVGEKEMNDTRYWKVEETGISKLNNDNNFWTMTMKQRTHSIRYCLHAACCLTLGTWRWKQYVPSKHQYISISLHFIKSLNNNIILHSSLDFIKIYFCQLLSFYGSTELTSITEMTEKISFRNVMFPSALVRLEDLGKLKKFDGLVGIWTPDFPACSIAPQPSTVSLIQHLLS